MPSSICFNILAASLSQKFGFLQALLDFHKSYINSTKIKKK
jgi:hypothetical protein